MAPAAPIRVFISYSHDSPQHMNAVLALANRLRQEGIDCWIDQYKQSPAEGWPRWCENQIEEARFVLVVCTETYLRRFKGKEGPGKGKGVTFEGYIITQELYNAEGKNEKFIPVVFGSGDREHIPILLQGASNYDVSSKEGYDELYFRILGQPRVIVPDIGPTRNRVGTALNPSSTPTPSTSLPKLEAVRDFGPHPKRGCTLTVILSLSLIAAVMVVFLIVYLKDEHSGPAEMETTPYEIMKGAELSPGFNIGVNSALGVTDWVVREGDQIRMSYPGSQAWGAVFIKVGPPGPPPHPFRDFSTYRALSIDLKGQAGGEAVDVGIKGNNLPDDGSEAKVHVNLTSRWQTFRISLLEFRGTNLKEVYVVAEFVFSGSHAETVYFRNVRYIDKYGSQPLMPSATGPNSGSDAQSDVPRAPAEGNVSTKQPVSKLVTNSSRAKLPSWADFKARIVDEYPSVAKLEPVEGFVCTASPDLTTQIWDWSWEPAQNSANDTVCRQDIKGMEKDPQGVLYPVRIAAVFKFSAGKWQLWKHAIRRE